MDHHLARMQYSTDGIGNYFKTKLGTTSNEVKDTSLMERVSGGYADGSGITEE